MGANTENDLSSALNILRDDLGGGQIQQGPTVKESIDKYDNVPQEKSMFGQIIESSRPKQSVTQEAYNRGQAASELAADEYGKLDELNYGSAPNQEIMDPNAMIGSTATRVSRGIKAGWGDLLYGTGETVDFINAWARPGDPEPSTSVGEYFKKVGTEYQNENLLVLSEGLQDITFEDMFKGEFWSSKISRLVPYAASFMIPYAGGAKLGGTLLGRFGIWSAKAISKSNKLKNLGVPIGAMGRGIGMGGNGIKGSGILGKLAYDGGKKGFATTKFMRNTGGFIGGGAGANLAEGAYLSGEAYSQMLGEVDEQGNKLFTPKEAADHAAGVMTDNAKWMGVDMIQYGLLFGGIGKTMARRLLINPLQTTPFKAGIKGLTASLARNVLPKLPATAAYAGIEGVTEGIQETYQEWIKYANIQEAKGEEYESMTDWVKDEYGNYKPEIRDLFWSSVGLGGSMGGARGYFDAGAERSKALTDHHNALKINAELLDNAKTPDQQYVAEQQVQDNIISTNVWNYSGDGSVAIEYVNNMVKDKKMSQETADEYIQAIEESEVNYEKHTVNSLLTEAGAKLAFFRETRKSRNGKNQSLQEASYKNDTEVIKENIKNPEKQKEALEIAKVNHQAIMEVLQNEQQTIETEIEDIYTLRVDKAPIAKSTGQRDSRFKKQGLTKDEMTEYSQKESEAAKKNKVEEPSLMSKVIQGAKELGGKAVEGAKGLVSKTKEKVTSEEVKKAIKEVKEYDKTKITSGAKAKLIKALETGKILAKRAKELIGTGIDKIINNNDVEKAVNDPSETSKEEVKKKINPK